MQASHANTVEEVPSQGPWLEELLCGGPEVLVSFDDQPCTNMNQVAWKLAKIAALRFAYGFKHVQLYRWHSAGEGCVAAQCGAI